MWRPRAMSNPTIGPLALLKSVAVRVPIVCRLMVGVTAAREDPGEGTA